VFDLVVTIPRLVFRSSAPARTCSSLFFSFHRSQVNTLAICQDSFSSRENRPS
jgi:hypothetical protein